MANTLTLNYAIVSNVTVGGPLHPTIRFFDNLDQEVGRVDSGQVLHNATFVATYVRTWLPHSIKYNFPFVVALNPGETIVFSIKANRKRAYVLTQPGLDPRLTFDLLPGDMVTALGAMGLKADAALEVKPLDEYMKKVLALAHLHALLGSTREKFNSDLKARGIKDTAPLTKLSQEEFKAINDATPRVRLQGSATSQSDQQIYDESAMLSTAVNARLAAQAKNQHPEDWDITNADNQIKVINMSANNMFNFYLKQMGPFETSTSMSSQTQHNTYSTATIRLDALVDLFKSLALPPEKLLELSGLVDSFLESVRTLSSSSSKKNIKSVKLVNFFSVQPPFGNPDLDKVSLMRMFYLDFEENTSEWSTACASGSHYTLDTNVFTFDVELNRQICHLTYDHNKDMLVKSAEAALDEMDSASTNLKADGKSPIGPPPPPN